MKCFIDHGWDLVEGDFIIKKRRAKVTVRHGFVTSSLLLLVVRGLSKPAMNTVIVLSLI